MKRRGEESPNLVLKFRSDLSKRGKGVVRGFEFERERKSSEVRNNAWEQMEKLLSGIGILGARLIPEWDSPYPRNP